MDDTDRTLDAVGPRLKELRQRRDITLNELAAETGISISTLSRLEAGLRRPTLEQLLPLARAYSVTLDELVDAPPTGDPRSALFGAGLEHALARPARLLVAFVAIAAIFVGLTGEGIHPQPAIALARKRLAVAVAQVDRRLG